VIWGDQDRIIPIAHAAEIADSVRVEIIEGAGHMVQMEAASEVNGLIESFLG
jgi:pyruvate dehydrogenase E2 component (dihydrolipoamide acetyltransferase)